MNKNIVQFRNGFINLPNAKADNYALAMSVVSELMQFGYVLDESAIDNLRKASVEDITSFHNEVIDYLKEMTGSGRNYSPFWKGFPEQVMQKSECELWLHQIVHYMSNGSYEPNEWTKQRPTAFENPKYTKITAGDEDKFLSIFTDLVSVNNSLTPDDMEIVEWFVNNNLELRFPNVIPFKENLCTLAGLGIDVPVKTVTDVLRIAVHMSGGDISLPKVPSKKVRANSWSRTLVDNTARDSFKFKKFKRAERRYILGLLEKTNCMASEAVLKDQRWIRLGEILHPGEYKNKFPRAFKMFDKIRNHKVQSWYGEVDSAFKVSFEEGLKKLSERPGELMRRLDWLLRSNGKERRELIFSTLDKVAPKVSNKVIFELYSHLEKRRNPVMNRSIMLKGARSRTKLPDLPAIGYDTVDSVQKTLESALMGKFASLDKLGDVYVDEELKNIPLPTNMRSASSSLKPTIRGQRTPIGNKDAKYIRAFVHWFDKNGREDIDLSGLFIGMGKKTHIGWNGSHNGEQLGCYSGDIRYKQGPCAEYLDINVLGALKEGYKYAIINAANYEGRSFESVPECVAGYMEREHMQANEIFVPKTIANCTRLTSESSQTLVSVIDLEAREVIHLDIDQSGIPVASANFDAIMEAVKPYCEPPAFSVYDLILLHVDARGGNLVEDKDEAETSFMFDEFSSSYVETLKLMGV
jgi:hypothetical protein